MKTENKQKQIVVNVSEESKTKINSLKEKFKASDKEFIEAVIILLETVSDEKFQEAVEKITVTKQIAKVKARIAKLEAKIAEETESLAE